MSTRRSVLAAGVLSAVPALMGLSACQPTTRRRLRAGYVKVLAALPFIFAHRRGLFEQQSVEVEAIEFGTSNDVATAAVTGQIDFVGAGATNATLDAIGASNKLLKIFTVNDYVKRTDNQSSDFLLSLPEHDTLAKLRGQPIAIFPGSFGRMFARLVFPRLGLPFEQLQLVEMQPGQWLAAMQSGAVKAVTALEPFATQIMQAMQVNILVDGYYATVMQNVPGSGSWFIADRLQRPDEERIFAAMSGAIANIETDRAAVNEVMQQFFSLTPEVTQAVRMLDWRTTRDPGTVENLVQFASTLQSEGGISHSPPADQAWIWR